MSCRSSSLKKSRFSQYPFGLRLDARPSCAAASYQPPSSSMRSMRSSRPARDSAVFFGMPCSASEIRLQYGWRSRRSPRILLCLAPRSNNPAGGSAANTLSSWFHRGKMLRASGMRWVIGSLLTTPPAPATCRCPRTRSTSDIGGGPRSSSVSKDDDDSCASYSSYSSSSSPSYSSSSSKDAEPWASSSS